MPTLHGQRNHSARSPPSRLQKFRRLTSVVRSVGGGTPSAAPACLGLDLPVLRRPSEPVHQRPLQMAPAAAVGAAAGGPSVAGGGAAWAAVLDAVVLPLGAGGAGGARRSARRAGV